MAKATLTIAIGGEYNGKALDKAEQALRKLNLEAARHAGGMTEALAKAGDSAVKLGTDMQSAGDRIAGMGASVTKATAPIAAIGAASVKLASDYENAVAKVYTIMDKNVMSTEAMSKTLLDLSTNTGKSATELADAAYQALSASVATDKVAGFVEDAVKLSKAGFTETATAVDTLTTVINAYGYSADDASMISERLIQTQNKGKTTVDELAQSMGNVIPTASAYNVSLDNLCSAYVIMTKQGINTANATTAINGMLTELADAGSTVSKILGEQTGKSFGQLMAEGKDLGEVIQILKDYVDGDSEAFANLWGNVRASKGALAIANAGAAEFTGAMGDMAESAGLVDKALDDLDTPMAKANKALNAVKNTGIQLGEEIIGAAVPSLEKLGKMAQDLYRWFSQLDEGTRQNIVKMGALAVAAGPVITAFGKLYGGVGSLVAKLGSGMQGIASFSAAMKATGAEMTAAGAASVSLGDKLKGAADKTGMLSKASGLLKGTLATMGVAAAAAAIGIVIAKLVEWKQHTDMVDQATRGLETAVGAAQTAYDGYAASVDGATASLEGNGITAGKALESQAQLAQKMNETWTDIGTNAAMVDRYAQTISQLATGNRLTAEEQARLTAAVDGFNQLTGAGIEVIDAQNGRLSSTREAILGVAEAYKEEAKAAAAKEILSDLYKQQYEDEVALKAAQEELNKATQDYTDAMSGTMEQQAQALLAVDAARVKVDEMTAAYNSVNRSIDDHVGVLATIPQRYQSVEAAMASCGTSLEGLGSVTDEQLAAIKENFDGTLQSIYDACVEQGVNIPEGLKAGIEASGGQPAEAMGAVASGVVDAAKETLDSHSPSKVMMRVGTDIDLGLKGGIDGSAEGPRGSMTSLAQSLERAVSGLPGSARRTGTSSGSNMAAGISSQSGNVATAAATIARSASNGVSGTPGAFSDTGSRAASSFSGSIGRGNAYWDGASLAQTAQRGAESVDGYGAGQNFAYGFANGMGGVDIWGAAYNIGASALDAIKWALGIASPSKKAMEVGRFFGQGAVIGMQQTERDIAAETDRLGGLMDLAPGRYGATAGIGAEGARGERQAPNVVTMNVTVNVTARDVAEARAKGTGLADALYEELSRKMESSLWPVSYTTA